MPDLHRRLGEVVGKLDLLLEDRRDAAAERKLIVERLDVLGLDMARTTERLAQLDSKHSSLASVVATLAQERHDRLVQKRLMKSWGERVWSFFTKTRIIVGGLLGSGGLLAYLTWPWPKKP